MYRYKVVTVGGTWDFLHSGHKSLLRRSFEVGEKVIIGVTSDEFAQKKHLLQYLVPFAHRVEEVEGFLRQEGVWERGEIVKIDDIFGPLKKAQNYNRNKEDLTIEAMIVTKQTKENAEYINKWRVERGIDELDIVEVGMVLAEDGKPISSSRIKSGECDREGVVWSRHKLWGRLPKSMREELREPMGDVWQYNLPKLDIVRDNPILVSVGDVSTKRFLKVGIKPDLAVFDLRVGRKKVYRSVNELRIERDEYKIIKIRNLAGTVSKEIVDSFLQVFTHMREKLRINYRSGRSGNCKKKSDRIAFWVEGEEDLAVLPAVLFAPLGSVVVYGQPALKTLNSGLVIVNVTEEKKREVFEILKKFER